MKGPSETPTGGDSMSECNCKHTARSEEERRALTNRLRRIEGQVRGICRMVEEDAYCVDILTQTAAIASALSSFEVDLLSRHIKGCAVRDIKEGREDAADELIATVARLIK